jgi:iron complex outermembrane recepter protein
MSECLGRSFGVAIAVNRLKAGGKTALFASVALSTFLDFSPKLRAQTASGSAADSTGLEEVIVTARRREEVLQTTPLSVTALSGAQLEAHDVRGIDQISQFIPNVASVPTAGYVSGATTFIRGIGEHEILVTQDSPVGQYLDGVYIAGQTSTNFDLVDVQRVEVLRGPQGTLFGRNTTGGAINIVTKKPSDDFGIEEKFGYGSYNDINTRTEINTGAIGTTGITGIVAYQHRQMDGYVNNVNTPPDQDPGAMRSDAVWVKLHGDWDELRADYSFDFDKLHGQTPASPIAFASPELLAYYAHSPALGGATLVVNPSYQQNVSLPVIPEERIGILGHALTLQYDINPDLSVKSITGYRQFWLSSATSYAAPGLLGETVTGVAPVTPFIGTNGQRLLQYSEELQLLGSGERWNYVGGLYFFHDRVNENEQSEFTYLLSPTLGVNTQSPTVAEQSSESEAAFGQVNYRPPVLDDKLEITGGLRFTRDSKSIDQTAPIIDIQTKHYYNLSYNVTLNYQIAPDLMAYGRISSGYRSGGFNVRASAGQGLNFAPEKATVYEGGIKSEWLDHRLRVNASGFYTNYENLQVSQFTGETETGGNSSGVKNANADYAGFELEVEAKPIQSVTLDGGLGYVHPEYQQIYFPDPVTGLLRNYAGSARFPYVPEWTNHFGVQYEFPAQSFGRFILRSDYSYQSSKYFFTTDLPTQNPFNDLIKAPDQNLVSARLTLTDVSIWNGKANLEASFWGENLLNDHYLIQGVDFGPALGFATKTYGIPRRFGFDVRVRY